MCHLSTACLIISIIILVHQGGGVKAEDENLLATESKHRAVTIIHNPQYLPQTKPSNESLTKPVLTTHKPEHRLPNKPSNITNKIVKPNNYVDILRPHHGQIQKLPGPRRYPTQTLKLQYPNPPNALHKYPRVIPIPNLHRTYYIKPTRPLAYAASTVSPFAFKSPKFSVVHTINGIRNDIKPPNFFNKTSTLTTTTVPTTITTTQKLLRTKRIWPKRVQDNMNSTLHNTTKRIWPKQILNRRNSTLQNTTFSKENITGPYTSDETDHDISASYSKVTYAHRYSINKTTPAPPSTTRVYRPVTRKVKAVTITRSPPTNSTFSETNDWVPMPPSHYANLHKFTTEAVISKRSDILLYNPSAAPDEESLFLHTLGLLPMPNAEYYEPIMDKKNTVTHRRKPHFKPRPSRYRRRPSRSPRHMHETHQDSVIGGSHRHYHRNQPKFGTEIKHHHHHHHHRYVKTVEKPVEVPYKVEVPKPYPVRIDTKVPVPVETVKVVEKPVPYPVPVEKRVPYPIGIKIPQLVPYKVVEKEYVPKPYPVIQKVPVVKHVQVNVPQPVPVPVEKNVPFPIEVKVPVPVDRPVPVAVPVEKQVPYPVPIKVYVPQPYTIEKQVPYPVEVKVREPVEIVRHVPIKVPYPQPYAVKIPHPIPIHVEKRVPVPFRVERKVPVPVEVAVPHKVEVEKTVPIYIPKPYAVEKKVPYPVRVPYPIRVPIKVPMKVEVPVYVPHPVAIPTYYEQESPTSNYEAVEHYGSSTPGTVALHRDTNYNRYRSRSDNTKSS